jgi:TRAP-type C4-dicarboxylate transport system permease small subunit
LKYYVNAVLAIGAALMAVIVVVMGVQVFDRYFLGGAIIWAEEVCRYCLIWTTFLLAGVAFMKGEMAAMEMLMKRAPHWVRAALLGPAYGASAIFLFVLTWYGWLYADGNANQSMPAAGFIAQSLTGKEVMLSIFWVYLSVPIGCALLGLHMAFASFQLFVRK